MAAELKETVRVFAYLSKDGCGGTIDPGYLSSWTTSADHGIETVAFTFVVHHCRKEFIKAKTVEVVTTLVAEVRDQVVTRHKVALTPQMEMHLSEFETGKRVGDEHIKRQQALAGTKTKSPFETFEIPVRAAAPPPAAPPSQPEASPEEPPSQPKASPEAPPPQSAPPAAPPAAAPSQPDAVPDEPAKKKSRFSARLSAVRGEKL